MLHPNPLSLPGKSPELFKETNNVEPRVPLALQQSEFKLSHPDKIKSIVFCSGQVYYNLYKTRQLNELKDVVIVRVEQICPFPFWEVQKVVDYYGKSLEEIVWAQEESMNSGCKKMLYYFT